jgi:hypothetical protein
MDFCVLPHRGACLTLGGQSYTETELINILKTPVAGDASLNLAHQFIAAEVNINTGSVFNPNPVGPAIDAANLLLSLACGGSKLPCNVGPSSPFFGPMVNVAAVFDAFNSGALTPVCLARVTPGCSGT